MGQRRLSRKLSVGFRTADLSELPAFGRASERKVPAFLAIVTVPLCSFISFFIATKIILNEAATLLSAAQLLEVGIISLSCTIILDLLITVLGGKMDIRVYPVNLMYLFAWFVIIPSVVLAGH